MKFLLEAFKARQDFWIYLIITGLIIVMQFAGGSVIFFLVDLKDMAGNISTEEVMNTLKNELHPALLLPVLVLPFILIFFSIVLLYKPLHNQSVLKLFTAFSKFRYRRMFMAGFLWIAIMSVFELVFYLNDPGNYTLNSNFSQVLQVALVALLVIPIQATVEELLFRSYYFKGITLVVKYPAISIIICSLIFGLLHASNPEVGKYGLMNVMPVYIGTGLLLGLLTFLDDGLELAMGYHIVNNLYGSVFFTFESSALPTKALFSLNTLNLQHQNIAWLIGSILFFLILSKIYKFSNYKTLLQKLEKPQMSTNDETIQ